MLGRVATSAVRATNRGFARTCSPAAHFATDSYDKDLPQGFTTLQLHAGHKSEPHTEAGWGWGGVGGSGARALPIYATTSFAFKDAAHGAKLFGLEVR
jgi:hypothetical protein